jgi:hypothetical protein
MLVVRFRHRSTLLRCAESLPRGGAVCDRRAKPGEPQRCRCNPSAAMRPRKHVRPRDSDQLSGASGAMV